MKYKITQPHPFIFHVAFDNQYDMAMTFLRSQEYYESPNKKFRGAAFTLVDYMEWYSKQNGNVFTYAEDWAGFNIPDWVPKQLGDTISDRNKYDEVMSGIVAECRKKCAFEDIFYVIASLKSDKNTKSHEIAHGLYYVNELYRFDMDKLVRKLPANLKKIMKAKLKEMGYDTSVYTDEMQAYLSTGLNPLGREFVKKIFEHIDKSTVMEFENVFKKYAK